MDGGRLAGRAGLLTDGVQVVVQAGRPTATAAVVADGLREAHRAALQVGAAHRTVVQVVARGLEKELQSGGFRHQDGHRPLGQQQCHSKNGFGNWKDGACSPG